ncbi:hypothetical protein L9F63_010404, partial [Diploptera punctata]
IFYSLQEQYHLPNFQLGYSMVIKSRSDIFCEIINLFWTLRICGVIQFTLHGKICNQICSCDNNWLNLFLGNSLPILRKLSKNFDSYP